MLKSVALIRQNTQKELVSGKRSLRKNVFEDFSIHEISFRGLAVGTVEWNEITKSFIDKYCIF